MKILNLKNKNQIFNSSFFYVYKGNNILTNITEISNLTKKIISQFFDGYKLICGSPEFLLKSHLQNSAIHITIPYFSYDNLSVFETHQLYGLQQQISEKISKEIVLNFILLKEPYIDATVLAQYISEELEDGKFFKVITNIIGVVSPLGSISELPIVSNLIGIKVKISGRLNSERSQPRMTKQSIEIGSFKLSNETNITLGSFTTSNKKGSNTVRVWLSHLI